MSTTPHSSKSREIHFKVINVVHHLPHKHFASEATKCFVTILHLFLAACMSKPFALRFMIGFIQRFIIHALIIDHSSVHLQVNSILIIATFCIHKADSWKWKLSLMCFTESLNTSIHHSVIILSDGRNPTVRLLTAVRWNAKCLYYIEHNLGTALITVTL